MAYSVTTGLVASSMVSGGVAHVLHVRASVDGFVRLGYPLHFVTSPKRLGHTYGTT